MLRKVSKLSEFSDFIVLVTVEISLKFFQVRRFGDDR